MAQKKSPKNRSLRNNNLLIISNLSLKNIDLNCLFFSPFFNKIGLFEEFLHFSMITLGKDIFLCKTLYCKQTKIHIMSSKKIDFLLPADVAAGATSGILLGDFNNWDSNKGVALKQQKDGSLKASVSLQSGSYEYRYLLNDGRWVNDTQASKYTYNSEFAVENCVIEVASEVAPAAPKAATKTVKAKAEPVAEKAKAPAKVAKAKTVAEPKVEAKATKTTKAKKA